MKTVTAAEANRRFSSVLREAANGETFVITSRGKSVAVIGPARQHSAERSAAKRALLARLLSEPACGTRSWTRGELYE